MNPQEIVIFETADVDDESSKVLSLSFSDLDSIKCRTFRSNGGSYYGGRVELVGSMDNEWKERVVLKMEMHEFIRFKAVLKSYSAEQEHDT
jgi:hypothetical protein